MTTEPIQSVPLRPFQNMTVSNDDNKPIRDPSVTVLFQAGDGVWWTGRAVDYLERRWDLMHRWEVQT